MTLEIDQAYVVTTDERKWTVRARTGSVRLPASGRSVDVLDYGNVHALAMGLHRHGLIDRSGIRPCDHLYAEAEVLAAVFRLPVDDPSATVTFANGAFLIASGMGDVVLRNPSLEVARQRTDTDAAKVRSIVAYPATVRAALLTAVERTLMKCDLRIRYADLERTAYGVAAELWRDIQFSDPVATPTTALRVAAGVRDRLLERSGAVQTPGQAAERHPCTLRGRGEVAHGHR